LFLRELLTHSIDGQLTDTGRQTMARLGAHIRSVYVDKLGFLPSTWSQTAVESFYLRSSNFPRTFESVHSILCGLYPKSFPPKNTETKVPNPTIHTRPKEQDDNIYIDFRCKRLNEIKKSFFKSVCESGFDGDKAVIPTRVKELINEPDGERAAFVAFDNVACGMFHI
jgi:Histidine phosphatase superfamily (branch 2)